MLSPLFAQGQPVDWWFAFKFNAATYPDDETGETNPGIFGGTPDTYKEGFCLSYVAASSANPVLTRGQPELGTSLDDPLGATFNQVYNGNGYYVLWNDQFYDEPMENKSAPWGHSKGLLAWDDTGAGFVLQVSTPSWPASGNAAYPRANDGNTLGCINDDDVEVSQHFFALKLTAVDVVSVLKALNNARVVTDPGNLQIVRNGGPADIQALVEALAQEAPGTQLFDVALSSGVGLISKPASLHVPPWQMVSATLGGVPLRVASWWTKPEIASTTAAGANFTCWDASLPAPGPVEIATSGTWNGKSIGLEGGDGTKFNHAKVGVSKDPAQPFCIFGDMNQQGALNSKDSREGCASSQNGRGGLFFVLQHAGLHASLTSLLAGDSA